MRLALADAGDGMEDANFVHDTADKGILRLTKVCLCSNFAVISYVFFPSDTLQPGVEPVVTHQTHPGLKAQVYAVRDKSKLVGVMFEKEAVRSKAVHQVNV